MHTPQASQTPIDAARQAHRHFLNRYYGISRHFYDLTRKAFLFGRDSLLTELALDTTWHSLIEIGVGTGRNLRVLHHLRPDAKLGGIDASDQMLQHARTRCPWATFAHGFAEDVDYLAAFGQAPDRILFSYCLSMFQDPRTALEHARQQLAPLGKIAIVDFADLSGLPRIAQESLRRWLSLFHVTPLQTSLFDGLPHTLRFGPTRYYLCATLPRNDR